MAMKKFFVGVKGIIVKDGKVLLVSGENGFDRWDTPGGRIDDDETILQTLERELKEELPNFQSYKSVKLVHAERIPRDIAEDTSLVLLFHKIEGAVFGAGAELGSGVIKSQWFEIDEALSDPAISPGIVAALRAIKN